MFIIGGFVSIAFNAIAFVIGFIILLIFILIALYIFCKTLGTVHKYVGFNAWQSETILEALPL